MRELALFNLGIDSELRGCDLVAHKVQDVCHDAPHLGTRQHARILGHWVDEPGLDCADYGTHSMRGTKATLIYRRAKNLRAVQLLLGHSNLESTVRRLGIEVDHALESTERTET